MDKIARYQALILQILADYSKIRYSNMAGVENRLIADKENHRYQIVTMGWDKDGNFIHDCPLHIDIINGKIWVQWNMTDLDLDRVFLENGVPKSEIVIGFFSPEMREYTDYALA